MPASQSTASSSYQQPPPNYNDVIGIEQRIRELSSQLTGKQLAFAQLMASLPPMSQVDAYRQAYNVADSTNPGTTRSDASVLASHHIVSPLVDLLREQANPANRIGAHDREAIRKAYFENVLSKALSPDTKPNTALKAWDMLGKSIFGAVYVQDAPSEAGKDLTASAALIQQLQQLTGKLTVKRNTLAAGNAVDVEAIPANPLNQLNQCESLPDSTQSCGLSASESASDQGRPSTQVADNADRTGYGGPLADDHGVSLHVYDPSQAIDNSAALVAQAERIERLEQLLAGGVDPSQAISVLQANAARILKLEERLAATESKLDQILSLLAGKATGKKGKKS